MRIVKLNAIPSTNDYLKKLSHSNNVENFMCVVAENQTQGRGQMGAQWAAEAGKNLTFSVYVEKVISDISQIYLLNVAVAVSIFNVLQKYQVPKLSVKWPNDIMADTKKLGGVLIENSMRGDGSITSILGIGINVNQIIFENMPTATSLALLTQQVFDKTILLENIIAELELVVNDMKNSSEDLWTTYKSHLFKKDVPMVFEVDQGKRLMGIIKDVTPQGLLVVEHSDEIEYYYNIKEIKMLY